jgi:hypothetical protein
MKQKNKALPVTGCGGLNVCKIFRFSHSLDKWLTDGGEVISPIHRPRSASQRHLLFLSLVLIPVRGWAAAGRIR